MSGKGLFLVFTGNEGSGKSTQVQLLCDELRRSGIPMVQTKEPGGDEVANEIRETLLKKNRSVDPITEVLLFEASRAQNVGKIIVPALEAGKIVVCDRFSVDTYAYQVVARKAISADDYFKLDNLATRGLKPDYYFWIDIDPEVGLARKQKQAEVTRMEQEKLSFHKAIRSGYGFFFQTFFESASWSHYNGENPIDLTHESIITEVGSLLEKKGLLPQ